MLFRMSAAWKWVAVAACSSKGDCGWLKRWCPRAYRKRCHAVGSAVAVFAADHTRSSFDALSYIFVGRDDEESPLLYERRSFHTLLRPPALDLGSPVVFFSMPSWRALWVAFWTLFLASWTSLAMAVTVVVAAPRSRATRKVSLACWSRVCSLLTSGDRREWFPASALSSSGLVTAWGVFETNPRVACAAPCRAVTTAAFDCFAYSAGVIFLSSSCCLRARIAVIAVCDFISRIAV